MNESGNLPAWMQIETDDGWGDDTPSELPGYKFYDGTVTLYFDPGPHVYFRYDADGNRVNVDGVTTVLDVINKPFLKAWAAKLAVEFVKDSMLLPDGRFKSLNTEEFLAMLHEAKGQHKVRLDIAGDIGHIAHDILETSIKYAIDHTKGIVLELKGLPEEDTPNNRMAINCANHAFKWMQDHNVRWLATERKVYSIEFDVAGTTDGICIVDSCTDLECCRGREFKDRKTIADWKSSNQIADSYAYQTAMYQFAQIEEFGEYIPDRWVLRLGKTEGDFEPWYLPADYFEADLEAFSAALQLYRSLKEITGRRQEEARELRAIINERKRVAREARKAQERLESAQRMADKKVATAARNEAKDALYKKLRAGGMSAADTKTQVAIEYPSMRLKGDATSDYPDDEEDEAVEVIEVQPVTKQASDPDVEWSITL